MYKSGHIYLGKYSGWYAVRDERFYGEDELVEGRAPTGAEVEWIEEDSYFFKLSAFQEKLLDFYAANPDFIAPKGRYNEVISFVKSGLKDLSVSRVSFAWGVRVPNDTRHVIYVWLDALFNYISALEIGSCRDFWPCDLHLIGKDILHFHGVYWPAFLMALNLPLPKRIFAHGWWLSDGEKMSKSLGNVLEPGELVSRFGTDYLRYFLLREVPFGQDGDFRSNAMCERINADLANNIGNLINRCMTFIYNNCDGKIPQYISFLPEDLEILNFSKAILPEMCKEIDNQRINQALMLIIQLGHKCNFYINAMAPWALKKTDFSRMCTVLYIVAEAIRVLGILLQPIMPGKSKQILSIYFRYNDKKVIYFDEILNNPLIAGEKVASPSIIFEKLHLD
jgi:methionyl-tRNA synthetase